MTRRRTHETSKSFALSHMLPAYGGEKSCRLRTPPRACAPFPRLPRRYSSLVAAVDRDFAELSG